MQFNKDEYQTYMRSPKWKQKRARALERARWTCEICGFSKWSKTLEVHHITYDRFGDERPGDLQVLCEECHAEQDKVRAAKGKEKSRKALHDARIEGWASKVYGKCWRESEDMEDVTERFYEWIESKA